MTGRVTGVFLSCFTSTQEVASNFSGCLETLQGRQVIRVPLFEIPSLVSVVMFAAVLATSVQAVPGPRVSAGIARS